MTEEYIKSADKALDNVTDFLPEDIPKQPVKIGIAAVGVIFLFNILKSVLSTALLLLFFGGGVFLWYKNSDVGSAESSGPTDPNDPLADVKRIMDKYKR